MYKIDQKGPLQESGLLQELQGLASESVLLVASDFDGTLSEFTEEPEKAALVPIAQVALRKLSELPNTHVVVISGRGLSDLYDKFEHLPRVVLVGSHGHEFDLDPIGLLTDQQKECLQRARDILLEGCKRSPHTRVEEKPHGVVFHYRGVEPEPTGVVQELSEALSEIPVGVIRHGNKVLEYSPVDTNKGDALIALQNRVAATRVVFIGDDVTDEAGFSALTSDNITVKVGPGETAARFRLNSCQDVAQFLAMLSEQRAAAANRGHAVLIDRHVFISDMRAAALIDENATVVWLCAPRFDSAPVFGQLVGGSNAGCFSISTGRQFRSEWIDRSLIVQHTDGQVVVTDFFDCSAGKPYRRAGRSDLIRIIEGSGVVQLEFAPRFDFGRVPTTIESVPGGLRIAGGNVFSVLESGAAQWKISREGAHDTARCVLNLTGERVALRFGVGTYNSNFQAVIDDEKLLESSKFVWSNWLSTLTLPKLNQDLVARSALTLRGLTYGPTGAILAAATTSLPESIEGVRNWDYRFCWPRDAALSASALVKLGATGPALRLLDWLIGILDSIDSGEFLSPLYTVVGQDVPSEAEVQEALGYLGSRPVRVGNLAAHQLQLDTLGPIAELMLNLVKCGAELTPEHLDLAERMVFLVERYWREPDSGIWEVRGERQHFTHSKLMCWYTVHSCIRVAEHLGFNKVNWVELEQNIRVEIEQIGFNSELDSYTVAYGVLEPDAALLWVLLAGFHAPDHPRSQGTLKYVYENLYREGSVLRYRFADALPGCEGEFVICRAWLIEALKMAGWDREAKLLYDEWLERIGALGLLSEEWHVSQGLALGNYPQAYSHLGFINATLAMNSD